MKTLKKEEFITFLKTISDKLDDEEINHEIPFCHIDKEEFNYINIIIPDHILATDINDLFNCSDAKEKKGIVSTLIGDFRVNFIKTNSKDWYFVFWYYSWNVLPILLDVLASSYGLRYTRFGLKYEVGNINITKNIKLFCDFFEIPFHMISNGFPSHNNIFSYVESSPMFESDMFNMKKFEEYDINFKYNKQYYENFLQHKPESKGDQKNLEEQIELIDSFFIGENFLEKISKVFLKKDFPNSSEKEISRVPINKPLEDLKEEKVKEMKKKKINLGGMKNNDEDLDLDFKIE